MSCFASGSCVGWQSIFKLSVNQMLGCSQSNKSYSSAQMGKLRHRWASPPQSLVAELVVAPGSLCYSSLSTGPISLFFCNYHGDQLLPCVLLRRRVSTGSKISVHWKSAQQGVVGKKKNKYIKKRSFWGNRSGSWTRFSRSAPCLWVLPAASWSSPRSADLGRRSPLQQWDIDSFCIVKSLVAWVNWMDIFH